MLWCLSCNLRPSLIRVHLSCRPIIHYHTTNKMHQMFYYIHMDEFKDLEEVSIFCQQCQCM